jgi:hypothetical protein
LSVCRTGKYCLYIKIAKHNSKKRKKSSFYEEKKFGRIDYRSLLMLHHETG